MMPFRRTCREATALMVAREDQALPWADRLALRLHLMACAACPRFARQMLTMRSSMRQWRHYVETESFSDATTEKNKN